MTVSKKTKSLRPMDEKVNLCVNKTIHEIAKLTLGIRTPEDLVKRLQAQLFGGECRISNVRVAEYDSDHSRLICGRKSSKIPVRANAYRRLKDTAEIYVRGDHKFDCLLVSAMWAKGTEGWRTYRCDRDDKVYIYQSFLLKAYLGQPVVINFDFFGISETYWIEINCPDNLLSAYSSGSVSFKGGTVERELPWVCEMQPTGHDFDFSL